MQTIIDYSRAREMLLQFFNVGNIVLEVFVPLEFDLDFDDVFGVTDLTIVNGFEVFLKLVKFGAQFFSFRFDFREALLRLLISLYVVFAFVFFKLDLLRCVQIWIAAQGALSRVAWELTSAFRLFSRAQSTC